MRCEALKHPINALVAVADYPSPDGNVSLMYVHVRNKQYIQNGINVTVLNFKTGIDYVIDNIPVITLDTYIKNRIQYDILICHAANIRNHYHFLQKYEKRFGKIIFFFHGHEVLRVNKVYPKPYTYMAERLDKRIIRGIYDIFKLWLWRKYLTGILGKTYFIFVSKWMLEQFLDFVKIPYERMENICSITYNCIGEVFEKAIYDKNCVKKCDFVTIRNYMDGSKYCIDFINELAKKNPDMSFLVIGKAHFFEHYAKADNLAWIDTTMDHTQIVEILQTARCALMPTRTDAQGIMACEMASIGMPVITSDIPVCHEIFDDFENVAMIKNDDLSVDLEGICAKLEKGLPYKKNEKYYNKNTSAKEIELIRRIASK